MKKNYFKLLNIPYSIFIEALFLLVVAVSFLGLSIAPLVIVIVPHQAVNNWGNGIEFTNMMVMQYTIGAIFAFASCAYTTYLASRLMWLPTKKSITIFYKNISPKNEFNESKLDKVNNSYMLKDTFVNKSLNYSLLAISIVTFIISMSVIFLSVCNLRKFFRL